MSSRRRSRSRSRDKKSLSSKLRMDSKPATPRITDPSLPAGRRREIDNVMKKARAQTSPTSASIWDKKLLEVEAKDPNRWRHSGYKSMYVDGRSPSRSRSRSRSFTRVRSPRSPVRARSPRSPPMRIRSPRSPPARARSPRSPPTRPRPPPPPRRRSPRSPPPSSPGSRRRCGGRSASASSVSSCSDDSCSMCSPKNRRLRSRSRSISAPRRRIARVSPPPKRPRGGRPPSPASPPPRRIARPQTPPGGPPPNVVSPSDRPTDPRRRPPPPPPRASSGKVIDVKGVRPNAKPGAGGTKAKPPLLTRIKKEGVAKKKRPGSPGAESSGSEDSSNSLVVPIVATTGLTLSDRFGKIAQWSADRERRDIENMRITKTGSNMKVMVEEDDFLYGSPQRSSLSPLPAGLFPESLLSAGQSRLEAWDDIRVRYQYYKDLGYLRDLSLEDYVKWEEWWYKYQDWLANERHYERWLESSQGSSGSSRRRKKRSASSRLN